MPILSRTPSIYQIRHIASGKVYVGSASNPRKRQGDHLRDLQNGKHHSRYLQRAYDKYGEDAFVFEVIEPVLFVELLIEREQHWIDTLHSADRKHGYNVSPTAGSPLGVKCTDEMRARQSERGKARNADPSVRAAYGAKMKAFFADPEELAKMSERSKAQFANPSERARMSDQSKARMADPAVRAYLSEVAKAQFADPAQRMRMSERMKELWATAEYRTRIMTIRAASRKAKTGK